MKKILQFGLFTLMVSGFMNANAMRMNYGVGVNWKIAWITPPNSSSQSAAVEEVQKILSQSLPDMVTEYEVLKSQDILQPCVAYPSKKVECPALYDFFRKVNACYDFFRKMTKYSEERIEYEIKRMLKSLEEP